MFRKLALPITLPIVLVTLLFGSLKTTNQAQVAAQSARPADDMQVVMPPFTHTYRLGILADITTLNVWAMHDTAQSVVNNLVLSDFYPSLYRFSDQQQAWVPYLASNFPTPIQPDSGYFVSHVPLKAGLQWSDGSSLTAVDVAFTINTAITMSLGGEWQAYNNSYLHHAEATSPLTLTLFYSAIPTIEQHQFGTLMGPIVSRNYWVVPVANALAQPNPITYLYNFVPATEPTAGPYTLFGRVPGFVISLASNPYYPLKGVKEQHYHNGTYQEVGPGSVYIFSAYGSPTGPVDLSYVYGPYFDEVSYHIYASESEAATALADGAVDVILNDEALSLATYTTLTDQGLTAGVENGRNQLSYLGLNHTRVPLGNTALRQALSIWLNRQAIIHSAGQDVQPTWDFLPSGQQFWYTGTAQLGSSVSAAQRVNQAVTLLADAGFTWDITPAWDNINHTIIPGSGLHSPTGTLVSPLMLLAPADNDVLAAAAQPLAAALSELGVMVTAVLTTTPAYNDLIWTQQNFDLFIADWNLDEHPSTLCATFTNTSANVSGYNNPTLNAQCADYLTAPDMLTAQAAIWQVQQTLAAELPYTPLFTPPQREVYRYDRVHYPYTMALDGLNGLKGLTAVARPVITAPIQPEIGTVLVYTGTPGARITVEVSAGSVFWPFVMIFVPQSTPGHPLPDGQQFINHAFDLEVPEQGFRYFIPLVTHNAQPGSSGSLLPMSRGDGETAVAALSPAQQDSTNTFFFLKPITITIQYRNSDVTTVDEDSLKLLYWSQDAWFDAGTTCGPFGPGYNNNPTSNILKVNVCHFTRFATAGN